MTTPRTLDLDSLVLDDGSHPEHDPRLLERACLIAAGLRPVPGKITDRELGLAARRTGVDLDFLRDYAQVHGWLA